MNNNRIDDFRQPYSDQRSPARRFHLNLKMIPAERGRGVCAAFTPRTPFRSAVKSLDGAPGTYDTLKADVIPLCDKITAMPLSGRSDEESPRHFHHRYTDGPPRRILPRLALFPCRVLSGTGIDLPVCEKEFPCGRRCSLR